MTPGLPRVEDLQPIVRDGLLERALEGLGVAAVVVGLHALLVANRARIGCTAPPEAGRGALPTPRSCSARTPAATRETREPCHSFPAIRPPDGLEAVLQR